MGWRRRPRTENERLLGEGARDSSEPLKTSEGQRTPRPWRSLVPLGLGVSLVLVVWLIPPLAPYAGILLPLLGLALGVTRLLRRTGALRSMLRGFLLVWLAVSVAVGVLVAIGGFYREDLLLLAVVLAVLAVLWAGDRWLHASRRNTRPIRST